MQIIISIPGHKISHADLFAICNTLLSNHKFVPLCTHDFFSGVIVDEDQTPIGDWKLTESDEP